MAEQNIVWTIEDVSARFHEAVAIGRRLPPVRVQGYFNLWPTIVRQEWECYAEPDRIIRFPPDPAAIDRMLETMGWVQWLAVERRHLVWMRADNYEWNEIGRRCGCCRTTAWRRWKASIGLVAERLNGLPVFDPEPMSQRG